MDVLDLDWSPKGYIASASIDNKVMIWDLTAHFANPHGSNLAMVASPYRVLDSHTSFVKGISFDPVGSFLASASADNIIILWNVDTWTVDATLTEPMADSVDRTIFRRINWAPDGGSLCVSSATKAAKPVGMVIKRDTWECLADLVGHDAQSTCCRFAPYIKVAEKKKKSSSSVVDGSATPAGVVKKKQLPCTIVALGDHQGVVSVWSTVRNTPLLVLRELFTGPVLDMAWTSLPGDLASNSPAQTASASTTARRNGGSLSPSATTDLLACTSLDGTLVLAMFDSGSLSRKYERIMTAEEQEAHFRKMYGRAQNEILETPEPLVEGPSVLKYRDGLKKSTSLPMPVQSPLSSSETANGQSDFVRNGSLSSSLQQPPLSAAVNTLQPRRLPVQFQSQQPPPPPPQQKVTVLKSGKKRIQPMLLNSTSADVSGSLLTSSPSTQILSNAPNYSSSRTIMNHIQNNHNASTSSGFVPSQAASVEDNGGGIHSKRAKAFHSDGALNGNGGSSALQTGNVISLTFGQHSFICRAAHVQQRQTEGEKSGETSDVFLLRGVVKNSASASAATPTARGGIAALLSSAEPLGANSKVLSLSAKLLSCPVQFGKVKHFNKSLSHITAFASSASADDTKAGVVWEAYVNGEVTAMCGLHVCSKSKVDTHTSLSLSLSTTSDGLCVVGTNDGALHLLSLESGLRLSPVFIVGAPIISIDLITLPNNQSRILLVTAEGDVLVYNHAQTIPNESNTQLCFMFKTSLRPLLVSMRCGLSSSSSVSPAPGLYGEQELEVQRAYLSKSGDVVVSVRSRKQVLGGSWQTFQFCQHTQLWMRIADMRNLLSG